MVDVDGPALDETFLALLALGQERDLLAVLILPGQVASGDGRRVSFLKYKKFTSPDLSCFNIDDFI